jgi:hypothetical protein
MGKNETAGNGARLIFTCCFPAASGRVCNTISAMSACHLQLTMVF